MNTQLPASRHPDVLEANEFDWRKELAIAEQLANWLDSKFEIPGIKIRFGIDAILGLIPGFGDAITSLASVYILTTATRTNMPRVTQARMAANIAVDWLMGSIPLIGDLFDIGWKANNRNVALLKRHLAATTAEQRSHRKHDWLFLILLIVGLMGVLAVAMTVAFFLLRGIWRAITV